MVQLYLGEAMLDRCSSCEAVWLDGGEQLTGAGPETAAASLSRYLMYSVTLPERAVRSTVGLTAGTVRESAEFLIPQCFRNSKTYEVVVENSLKFLTEEVGGVPARPDAEPTAEDFLARKAAGNFVDLAGLATLHVSPLWMLAIVSDVAYGSKSYLLELAAELQREGVIDESSTIHSVDDMLVAIQQSSGEAATLFDTPPLSVEQLRETLDNTRKAVRSMEIRSVLPQSELQAYWGEMREIAAKEGVSLLGVSGGLTMHALGKITTFSKGTLIGLRVAGGLVNQHVLGHYLDSLTAAREQGFYQTVRQSAEPYIESVWNNFADGRPTWTEDVVTGRIFGKTFGSLKDWFTRSKSQRIEPGQPVSTEPRVDDAGRSQKPE